MSKIPTFVLEPYFFIKPNPNMDEKDIHFTNKRVDETWKQNVSQESQKDKTAQASRSEVSFSNFVTSLGIQALIRMGELKMPGTETVELDLEAVKETIDLLILLKEKTKGNLTSEEDSLINSLIPDLQLKFVQHKTP